MNTETIERFRGLKQQFAMLRVEPTPCSTKDLGDILAVLEAARDYKAARDETYGLSATFTNWNAKRRLMHEKHDALLALIDLGGTK